MAYTKSMDISPATPDTKKPSQSARDYEYNEFLEVLLFNVKPASLETNCQAFNVSHQQIHKYAEKSIKLCQRS